MYRRRATLLTIYSLTALSKVRIPRNSLYSILGFVRTHRTAAERSEFQNHNGSNWENGVDYEQNPSGYYGGNQNHVGFQHQANVYGQEWRYRGNTGEVQRNPDGIDGGNTLGLRQNPRIEFQHKLRGQNGNFTSSNCRESNSNEYQRNPNEQNGSNYTGYHGEMQQNSMAKTGFREGQPVVQQNPNGFYEQRTLGFPGNGNGNYGEMDGQFKESTSEHYSGVMGLSQQKPNNYSLENAGMTQQSPNTHYSGSTAMSQQYPGNNYGSKDGITPQSRGVSDHYSGNTGEFLQNPNNIYMGNKVMAPKPCGNFHPGSSNSNQHGTITHYPGSDTMNQQSRGVYRGDSVATPNGYVRQNIGENIQNPIGSYNGNAGNYLEKSSETQSGIRDSHLSNNFAADGESVEAAEISQHRGTIEELDGFCKEGKLKEVVEVLGLLERQHIRVDLPRYLMLMKACGDGNALQEAKYVHEHLMRSVSISEVSIYNKMLEMYGKCASMDDAFSVFNRMPQRNLTSWDTMITWLAKNGLGEDAIELFAQFKKAGLKPDGPMFIGVFSACGVLGDVVEGMLHFESMSKDYGIVPSMVHYVGVVDMLGSAGYLDEALEFIEKMPVEPAVDVWESLMNSSRVHGHVELGDRCAGLVELMDASRLDEQSKAGLIPVKASDIAKDIEKKKLAADNLLAARSRVHEYRAGDKSHPEADKIYAQLRGMKEQMKEAGYVPETRFVLHDIDQEGKEEALLAHSERLAVAFGLMTSPARAQIRIIKNLRVCGDCHSALKIISKLVGRELIIRDAKRFHHFKDGLCSCRDYW